MLARSCSVPDRIPRAPETKARRQFEKQGNGTSMDMIANSKRAWIAAATAVLCGAALTVPASAQEKSKTNLKVAVFSHIGEVQTISGMMKAAVEDAKARGWTVETFDGRGDMVAVNNQANSFISRGFDALINVASPNDQMAGVINKARKAGIPFVSC